MRSQSAMGMRIPTKGKTNRLSGSRMKEWRRECSMGGRGFIEENRKKNDHRIRARENKREDNNNN
jgi:hypothetical protein